MGPEDPMFFQQGTENSFFWGRARQRSPSPVSPHCDSFLGLSSCPNQERALPRVSIDLPAANRGGSRGSQNPYNSPPVGTRREPSAVSLHTPLRGWPGPAGAESRKENIFFTYFIPHKPKFIPSNNTQIPSCSRVPN